MTAILQGVKILDLTRVLAGPWCTMTLGDLGAEVWKIENPQGGDDTRSWAPPETHGISTYYLSVNRNKKSIALDLKTSEGRQAALDLAAKADVVVDNFRLSSLKALGLAYDNLKAVNPRLIHCSISGYGQTGKFAARPGYDFVLQAETGFMAITGEVDGTPMRMGVAFIDIATGMNAVQAILAALYAREKTGTGQSIDISLLDTGLHFLANIASGYLNTGNDPSRFGNAHASVVPYQVFETSDGHIALAVGNDEQYRKLCQDVLKDDALYREAYRTNRGRGKNRDALLQALQTALRKYKTAPLEAELRRNGIPAGIVKSVPEAFAAEEARERGAVASAPHPVLGEVKSVRSPLRFSESKVVDPTAPPMLGEHTREILHSVLGYAPEKIAAMEKSGAALTWDGAQAK